MDRNCCEHAQLTLLKVQLETVDGIFQGIERGCLPWKAPACFEAEFTTVDTGLCVAYLHRDQVQHGQTLLLNFILKNGNQLCSLDGGSEHS